MEAQVLKSLGKLKKILPRNQKELKDVIDDATAKMTAALDRKTKMNQSGDSDPSSSSASTAGGGGLGSSTEVPFEPFLLAVLTRHAKLVAIALDCIEKFLAFGFLKGNGSIPESIRKRLVQKYGKKVFANGPAGSASSKDSLPSSSSGGGGDVGEDGTALNEDNWKLIDCIVEVICDTNDHPDETVQVQVLRVLLTAVTTPTCEVHEHSLLKAVRACYHIHLVSKNSTNQTVAKATLQQIISIIFQRMETFDQRVQEETEATLREMQQHQQSQPHQLGGEPESDAQRHGSGSRRRSALVSSSQAALYPDVARILHLQTSAPDSRTSSGSSSSSNNHNHHRNSNNNVHTSTIFAPSFPSVLHKDAFLLFRSLCRISMRSVAEDSPSSSVGGGGFGSLQSSSSSSSSGGANDDPFAFQSKILSLELVLSIINNAGPSFRRGERFIHAIRQYLCQSLLQNCTSNYTQIVHLSLQLFLVLINNFKKHLKAEIEIFVTSIFLRILQSENSSFDHKMLVLEVLHNLCDDAQLLGEIFLNYDCDWNTNDLFKQIIDALAKIAKGKRDSHLTQSSLSSSVKLKMQQNDAALVLKGLECLTATVASLKKAANFVATEKKRNDALSEQAREDAASGGDAPVAPPVAPPPQVQSSTMSAVEAFDKKKRRQEEVANGILKFNVKPSAGIQYLVQHGHLGQGTPRDVAKFLHENADKLDKTEVGEYLGKEVQYQNGFCVKTLHEYVDMMEFHGLEIDVAIRHFLAGFRLPGESQKIDRMMEKFAERFFNSALPGLFPSADTAFILSFSIIMLQTDLHNPSVPEEKKMTRDGFVRNNRGINNGEDLPEEYLLGIYDRIKKDPISLKEDLDAKMRQGGGSGGNKLGGGGGGGKGSTASLFGTSSAVVDRQRRDAYIKERETMVRQSEALFKRRQPGSNGPGGAGTGGGSSSSLKASALEDDGLQQQQQLRSPSSSSLSSPTGSSSQFHLVTEISETSYVRPMFETVWAPLLACCSVIFESSDSPLAIQLCLHCFKHAIHLSSRLEMPSERDAFVTVLAKFTALHTANSRLLKPKNMEAIKALISISVKEGNYLGDAWRDILQCISQLARLQTHAQGLHGGDGDFFGGGGGGGGGGGSERGGSSTPSSSALSVSTSSRRGGGSSTGASPSHRDSGGGGAGGSGGGSGPGGMGVGGDDAFNAAVEDENASRVMIEIDALASDRVFSSCVSLSDTAVQEFVIQLCVVSLSECSGVSQNGLRGSSSHGGDGSGNSSSARVFSLQKLVEVADMNMHTRSRVVWASTWKVLSRHFTTIGCHDNLSIAMYAIDSLRQLSMRFLEKEELKDFNFQRLFLTPFEVIMANAQCTDIKELVLRCVENMILARVANIRSGWKTIWGVLRVAAETYEHGTSSSSSGKEKDTADRIVQLGFQVAKRIFNQHFDAILDVFVDAVECLLAFAVCGSTTNESDSDSQEHIGLTQLSVDSILLLEQVCVEKLATGQVIEKGLLMEAAAASKRVGFTKKKANEGAGAAGGGGPLRYEKQESSRALHDEIEQQILQSPSSNGSRRRSSTLTASLPNVATAVYNDSSNHTRVWWPVLTALSTLASDRRLDVRLTAICALYDSLERHGAKFSSGLWALIFKGVLIPLLDELRHLENVIERKKRGGRPSLKLASCQSKFAAFATTKTTSTLCLERLLDTYGVFYDIVGFLPEVLFLLGKCMDTNDQEEQLASSAAKALESMLVTHGHKFPEDVWGLICDELRSVMTRAEPTWIFFSLPPSELPVVLPSSASSPLSPRVPQPQLIAMYASVPITLGIKFTTLFPPKIISEEEVNAQKIPSKTHLIVILAVQKVLGNLLVHKTARNLALSDGHTSSLMATLRESFSFARKVNDAVDVRRHLAKQGWQYGRLDPREPPGEDDLPNVLFQEMQGKDEYLKVLFHYITTSASQENDRKRDEARRQMTLLVKQTFAEYLAWTTSGTTTGFSYSAPSSPTAATAGERLRGSAAAAVVVPVDAAQRVARATGLMVSTLTHLAQFSGVELQRHLQWLYPLLNELIKTKNDEVRTALALVYSQSIKQLLPLQ